MEGDSAATAEGEGCPLDACPGHVLTMIVKNVGPSDLLALSLTCVSLRDAVRTALPGEAGGRAGLESRCRDVACSAARASWLVTDLGLPAQEVLRGACGGGHALAVAWAVSEGGCGPGAEVVPGICARDAAEGGHIVILDMLRGCGFKLDKAACSAAAGGGHLEALVALRAAGCPWDERVCSEAAGSGHIDVLRWARGNGCPWNSWTCDAAASGGYLDVLIWARAEGCAWSKYTTNAAYVGGHPEIVQWMAENGAPDLCFWGGACPESPAAAAGTWLVTDLALQPRGLHGLLVVGYQGRTLAWAVSEGGCGPGAEVRE